MAETLIKPLPSTTILAAKIINKNPIAVKAKPIENLAGLDKLIPLLLNVTHKAAKRGARVMMKKELND